MRPARSRLRSNRTSRSSEIGHGQAAACLPSCVPVLGDPNVVGVPVIVGTPVWVYGHVGVLGAAKIDGVEGGVMPLRGGSELITGGHAFRVQRTKRGGR